MFTHLLLGTLTIGHIVKIKFFRTFINQLSFEVEGSLDGDQRVPRREVLEEQRVFRRLGSS